MNPTAANKLLKLIEEPAENTLILLTTDDPSAILPTIASRTQRIDLRRISERDIARELVERYQASPAAAENAARSAQGSMGRALKLLREGGHAGIFPEMFVRFVRSAFMAKKKPPNSTVCSNGPTAWPPFPGSSKNNSCNTAARYSAKD